MDGAEVFYSAKGSFESGLLKGSGWIRIVSSGPVKARKECFSEEGFLECFWDQDSELELFTFHRQVLSLDELVADLIT